MKRHGLVIALLFTCGCGQNQPQPKVVESKKPVEYFHVNPATAGTVNGKILFRGTVPAKTKISMSGDEGCEKAHAGKPVYDQSVVVGKSGGLANSFVYLKAGLEGKTFETPQDPVVLDQQGCQYVPRVLGMRAGQNLSVRNSDTVSHNIHPIPTNNREWNQQQSPESPNLEHKFPRPDVMIPVRCNVHSWMRAFIGVLDHPYFAVTSDDGAFELKNVPPGDYTLAAWHEKYGEQTQQVHVAPSETAAVNFTYR